jgi:hypothetical protein
MHTICILATFSSARVVFGYQNICAYAHTKKQTVITAVANAVVFPEILHRNPPTNNLGLNTGRLPDAARVPDTIVLPVESTMVTVSVSGGTEPPKSTRTSVSIPDKPDPSDTSDTPDAGSLSVNAAVSTNIPLSTPSGNVPSAAAAGTNAPAI